MFSLVKKLSALALLASTLTAFAQDTIQLGYPASGGNGCPAGTASAVVSPDGSSLSIIFDQFTTESVQVSVLTTDRNSCNIAIPVHVPNGYSISIIGVD